MPAYADYYKILINIPSHTLELFENNAAIKTYTIGVGKPYFPTPVGKFKVISKIKNPVWENPYKPAGAVRIKSGKNNPLSTRWIGFYRDSNGEYGIHGTNIESSIGKYSSHGCIRMKQKEAEELFSKINEGCEVKITYNPYKISIDKNNIRVFKYNNVYKLKIDPAQMIKSQLKSLNKKHVINQAALKQAIKMKPGSYLTIGKIIN